MQSERVGKFWFSEKLPVEVKNSVKDVLVKNEVLIPSWCNEVCICWDDGEDSVDFSAYVETQYAYRKADLYICPAFLREDAYDRDLTIKHELAHIVSSPLLFFVQQVTGIMVDEEDDKYTKLILRESKEKSESMTEDLARIFLAMENKFNNDNTKK